MISLDIVSNMVQAKLLPSEGLHRGRKGGDMVTLSYAQRIALGLCAHLIFFAISGNAGSATLFEGEGSNKVISLLMRECSRQYAHDPLMQAIIYRDVEEARGYSKDINQGINVDFTLISLTDEESIRFRGTLTYLALAILNMFLAKDQNAENRGLRIIKGLLERGADPNILWRYTLSTARQGEYHHWQGPLLCSVVHLKSPNLLKILFDHGALVNTLCPDCGSLIQCAQKKQPHLVTPLHSYMTQPGQPKTQGKRSQGGKKDIH
jgi:hypothetical protein